MRADVWLAFISLPAVKTDSQRGGRLSLLGLGGEPLPFFPGHKIEGQENDQGQKNPHGPKKTAPNSVPPFLGVVKNPNGHDQADQRHQKRQKESHNHSQLSATRVQLSAWGFAPDLAAC